MAGPGACPEQQRDRHPGHGAGALQRLPDCGLLRGVPRDQARLGHCGLPPLPVALRSLVGPSCSRISASLCCLCWRVSGWGKTRRDHIIPANLTVQGGWGLACWRWCCAGKSPEVEPDISILATGGGCACSHRSQQGVHGTMGVGRPQTGGSGASRKGTAYILDDRHSSLTRRTQWQAMLPT